MRKITLLLLSILCVTFGAYSLGDTPKVQNPITITLKGKPLKQPRGGDLTSNVYCYYYNGGLYVEFYEPVEDVNVSITNVNTGEQYDTFAFGANQSVYVDVPTTSGQYYVEIECDSATWCGEYYL